MTNYHHAPRLKVSTLTLIIALASFIPTSSPLSASQQIKSEDNERLNTPDIQRPIQNSIEQDQEDQEDQKKLVDYTRDIQKKKRKEKEKIKLSNLNNADKDKSSFLKQFLEQNYAQSSKSVQRSPSKEINKPSDQKKPLILEAVQGEPNEAERAQPCLKSFLEDSNFPQDSENIGQEKQHLSQLILEAVQGEPNEAERAQRCLKVFLDDTTFPQDLIAFKPKLTSLYQRLLQPEALILKDKKFYLLSDPHLTLDHEALGALLKVIQDLKELIPAVPSSLQIPLSAVQLHYESYLKSLLVSGADRPALLNPKAILSGEDLFQSEGIRSYRISQDMALALLSKNQYGLFLKSNKKGSHAVCQKGSVYFKGDTTSDGLQVGLESASYALSQFLFGRGMAPTALLTLNEVEIRTPSEGSPARGEFAKACAEGLTSAAFSQQYPQYQDNFTELTPHHLLQASQEVVGMSLESFLEKGVSFQTLCRDSFSEQIVLSLLLNPSDGTPGNFMVHQKPGKRDRIIGIDNDKAFGPSIVRAKVQKEFKHGVEVKNILYCLPLMKEPISDSVRTRLLSLSPEQVILQWLSYLQIQKERYEQLKNASYFVENVSIPYLSSDFYKNNLYLPLKFAPDFISDMIERFKQIQSCLKDRPTTTHTQLFHLIDPLAARFYQALQARSEPILDTFRKILHSNAENIFLEEVLASKMADRLPSGQTVAQALAIETSPCDGTRAWTQTVPQTLSIFLSQLDLNQQKVVRPMIELVIPLVQDKALLHPSWRQDSLLLRALEEKVPFSGIKFLLGLGLDMKIRHPETYKNIFHISVQSSYTEDIFKLLSTCLSSKEKKTLLNNKDKADHTPLDYALDLKSDSLISNLINWGASQCHSSWAVNFYRYINRSQLSSKIGLAFQHLMKVNGEVEWRVTIEDLFPQKDSKAMKIKLNSYLERCLPQFIVEQIFDSKNDFVPSSLPGNRLVLPVQGRGALKKHHLYFKVYPALPGVEEASGSLTRQLLGFGAPYTELAKINYKPVLISQGIEGPTLLKVLQESPDMLKNLVDEDVSGLIIAAMLINPEDGKPDNYIVTPHPTQQGKYRLVGIDNDQAFVPAIVKEQPDKEILSGKLKPVVQVKTILYCLNQMKHPVAPTIRQRLINLSPKINSTAEHFLESWLKGLKKINKTYSELFNEEERSQIFKSHECFIGVPFQEGVICHLYEKFITLQNLLTKFPNINHIDLLAKLEPRLAKRYQEALNKNISLWQRFREVDESFYKVEKDGSNTTNTKSGMILQSSGIPLQEKMLNIIASGKNKSPVQALEELKKIIQETKIQALVESAARAGDINFLKSLILEKSRCNFLKNLGKRNEKLPDKQQKSVLKYLKQQRVQNLHLPHFSCLKDRFFTNLPWLEHLRHIDVRHCTRLTNDTLVVLSQGTYSLKTLNLSYLPQLRVIGSIGVFQDERLLFKNLHTLFLIEDIGLIKLLIQAPLLTHLDISGCSQLTDEGLNCLIEYSPLLKILKLERCHLISKLMQAVPIYYILPYKKVLLEILKSQDSSLILKNEALKDIDYEGWKNVIKILHLKTSLTSLNLQSNAISDMGAKALAHNTTLTALDLQDNKVDDAGAEALAHNTTLTFLDLQDNKVGVAGTKALAHNATLTFLNLRNNQVGDDGTKALARNTRITSLNLQYNKVTAIGAAALAYNTTLTALNLKANKINDSGMKDLALNTTLTSLNLKANQVGNVGIQALAHNTTLTSLNLQYNRVGAIGAQALVQNTTLTFLNLRSNFLDLWSNKVGPAGAEALALNTTLTALDLENNKVGDVGARALAYNKTLTFLDLRNNKVSDAGAKALARNTMLTALNLYANQVGDAGAQALAGNTTLTHLSLRNNQVSDAGREAFKANRTLKKLEL